MNWAISESYYCRYRDTVPVFGYETRDEDYGVSMENLKRRLSVPMCG